MEELGKESRYSWLGTPVCFMSDAASHNVKTCNLANHCPQFSYSTTVNSNIETMKK